MLPVIVWSPMNVLLPVVAYEPVFAIKDEVTFAKVVNSVNTLELKVFKDAVDAPIALLIVN